MLDFENANTLFFYEPDTGFVRRKINVGSRKSGDIVGSKHSKGYIQTEIKGKAYFVHRVAWLLHFKEWPIFEIDHINGIKHDNRICNLRDVPSVINQRNRHKIRRDNTSGCTGVTFNKQSKMWVAFINIEKRVINVLGNFKEKEDAIEARKSAEVLYYFR